MEMTGEQLIPASQQQTWDALNDPDMLKQCVPGCESIEPAGDNQYQAGVFWAGEGCPRCCSRETNSHGGNGEANGNEHGVPGA